MAAHAVDVVEGGLLGAEHALEVLVALDLLADAVRVVVHRRLGLHRALLFVQPVQQPAPQVVEL